MKFCICGGGTGGHLMIARSLVDSAVKEGDEAIFIGSTNGQDRRYFEHNSSFSHVYFLETLGVVNKRGLGKIHSLWLLAKAIFKARKLLQKHSVKAVYSVGGFSAAPAAIAAVISGIPLFIHEQNAAHGKLNSILRPFAKRYICAYEDSSPIKGYPVEELLFNKARVRKEIKSIIFLGGSQGAKAINDLALSVACEVAKRGIKIIHQAGEKDYERVVQSYKELGVDAVVVGFSNDLATLISHADLAISRSGASTLWELCANGLPALFIPYPHAAADHQFYNAQFIVKHDLGWCEREAEGLDVKLLALLNERLEEKSRALMHYSKKGVAKAMIDDMKRVVNG